MLIYNNGDISSEVIDIKSDISDVIQNLTLNILKDIDKAKRETAEQILLFISIQDWMKKENYSNMTSKEIVVKVKETCDKIRECFDIPGIKGLK